jgi:3-phenylpropionate/cinnamic acid dioxygenase small subunit
MTISVENRLAIHEFIAAYSHTVDNYRGQEWSEMFTEDGRLVGMEPPLVGREAFIAQSDKLRAGPTEYRHLITNVCVLPGATDEQASAIAYGTVADWAQSPPVMAIFVEYRFDLVKQGGAWKIARMEINRPYSKE